MTGTCLAALMCVSANGSARAQEASATMPLWGAHADIVGRTAREHSAAGVEFFVPLLQNQDSMIFIDAGINGDFDSEVYGTFGVGYRTIVTPDLILGGIVALDMTQTEDGNTFGAVSLGAEAIGTAAEARINVQLPFSGADRISDESVAISQPGTLTLLDNRLVEQVTSRRITVDEVPLTGVEGEIGVNLPIGFDRLDDQLKVFAGAYHYDGDGVDGFTGVSGRLEYSVRDVMGESVPGADLILSAGLTHDEEHGTNFAGEMRLRIPLGVPARTDADARVLSPIEERMTQRVVRTTRIHTSERTRSTVTGSLEPRVVTDPLTGLPLDSIYFADGAETAGTGSPSDPTTLEDAVQRAGVNGTIVAEGSNGTIDTPGVTLANGQRLVGGGVVVPVRLADGTITSFQLGQTAPTIVGIPTANVLSLAAGNQLQALTLNGGLNGIAGTNVGALTLQQVTIAGSAAAGFSIVNTTGTNTLAITGLSVSGTGGPGIAVNGLGGGTTTVTSFSGVGVASAGGGGVLFDGVVFDADPATAGFQRVEAGDLTIGNPANPAAILGDGLRLNQVAGDLDFASLLIANANGAGLFIRDRGGPGGDFSFGNDSGAITTVGGTAIDIDPVALAARFGTVSSTNAAGQGSGGSEGLFLDNIIARDAGTPALVIDSLLIRGAAGDGLVATNNAGNLVFGTTAISNVGGDGILAENNTGSLTFGTTSVTGAAGDGIELAGNTGAISFGTTTITNPGGTGIMLADNAGTVTFADTAISHPGLNGIDIAGINGSVRFGNVDITGLGTGTGVDLTDEAGFASTRVALAFQTLDITGTGAAGSVGIDYSGSTNIFDVTTGESGIISGVAVGIDLRNAAATGLFQFGDGSATDPDGRASLIDAARPLEIAGLNATTGLYNLRDVTFVGDFSDLMGIKVFYVDADGSNNPGIVDGSANDPGTLAQAIASGADVLALVDNQIAGQDVIDAGAAIQGAPGSVTLASGQRVVSFLSGDLIDLGGGRAPANLLVTGIDANIVRNPNAGSGAPRLTTTEGGRNTLVLGSDNALLGTVIDNGAGAIAVFGNGISGVSVQSSQVTSIALTAATGTGRIENSTIGQLALTGGTVALAGINADIAHSGAGAALSVTAGHSGSVSFDSASSITATGGTGLRFVGVSGVYALGGPVTLAGGANLAVSGSTGSLSFGNVAIAAPAGNGIDVSGTNGAISLGDVGITGVAAGAVALDFNGAVLTGAFTARSLVAAGAGGTPPAGSIGIDLRGVSGGQSIRIGVSPAPNPAVDTPSSLNNFATGVFVDASSNAAFTFGDGEDTADRASRINATTGINASSAPTLGNYNFLDVDFLGAAPGAGFNPASVYYFSETGTGTGATQFDPGSVGGAEASGANVLVPIGPTSINAANGGGLGSLDLAASQQLRGFQTANGTLGVGFTGPATIQISALSATINNLTGSASPTLTTTTAGSNVVNLSSGNQLSSISTTGGVSGIAGSSVAGLTADSLRIANTTGAGIALTGTSGTIAFTGSTSVTATGGAGVSIAASSGTVRFTTLSVDNSAAAGGGVSISGPGSFSVTNGLAIRTTTGAGLLASGGGSLTVTATAGAETIATSSGTALGLDGVTSGAGGLNLDTLSANGAATGIALTNVGSAAGGAINLGTVTLSGMTARGVDVAGTLGAGLTFGSLSIGLAGGTGTGFDLAGATLGAAITAGDFDVANAGARGTTIGVDLTGVAGNQIVRLGDANAGGQSSSVAGVATGVVISNTSSAQFTFGDGEAATDRGSTIDATTRIAAPGSMPAGASFNFRDLVLNGSPGSGFGVGRIFFVDSDGATGGGDGTGRDGANPAALAFAEANAVAGDLIVLVNNGAVISAAGSGADNTLVLLANQQVRGFGNGAVAIGFTAPTGIDFAVNSFALADPGSGAATLTSGSGADVITLGASGNRIDGFILDGSPAGAARGITGTGVSGTTIANMTVRNFGVQGINLPAATNTTLSSIAFSGNAVDLVIGGANTTLTNVTSTGTSAGTAIQFLNATGTTTLTNVAVTGAANGVMRFDNASGTVTATNVDLAGASALAVAGGNAAFDFDAASSIANTGGLAVSLSGRTGGSFTHAGTVTSNGPGAGGVTISGALAANTVTFSGTVNLGGTTALGASGVSIDNAGTASIVTFANLGVATTGVTALSAGNGGAVNVTAGSLSALGAAAVSLNGVAAGINLSSTQSTGGANNVAITNVGGSVSLGSGALSGATGTAVAITGGTANVSYAGSVSKSTAGQILAIDGHATGAISFSGAIQASGLSGGILIQNTTGSTASFTGAVTLSTGASNGVTLANNTGSVAFNGGLVITTTSGTGFTASGGGTINVAAAGTRQITTTTGQILSMNGVAIGTGVGFGGLAATGTVANADAINLTGVTGGAFSGGIVSIAGTSGAGSDGIEINGAGASVSFGATTIDNTGNRGIALVGANGDVTFASVDIDGAGGAGLSITGNTNAVTVTGGTIGNTTTNQGAISVSGGSGTVTIGANTQTAIGTGLSVTGRSAGTVTFAGTHMQSGAGVGVNLANSGGAVSFSNTLNLDGTGGGIAASNTGGTTNFGVVNTAQTGANAGIAISAASGSAVYNFNGQATVATSGGTGTGVVLSGAGTPTVSFLGGLSIGSGANAGFTASGGTTINVAAAGTRQITTTTGQILSMNGVAIGTGVSFGGLAATGTVANADAISLSGVTGGAFSGGIVSIAGTSGAGSDGISIDGSTANIGFGATAIGATAGNGIALSGNAGTVTFTGTTTLTNPGAAGVAVTGTNGAIGFDSLQIALESDNTTGVDLGGASLDAGFTATDFDLTSASPTGTTAINLSSTTSTGIVRFGDTNGAGQSATIGGAGANAAGPTTGIQLAGANIANFFFGDGESSLDQGSRITATNRLDASPGPAGGSYNILDVDFLGAAPGPGFVPATAYYFSATGTGTGSTIGDPGSIAGAQASNAELLIPVGATPIDAASAGGSLALDANQQLRAFDAPNGTLDIGFAYAGAGVIQTTATAGNITDTAGDGSPVLTTTVAAPVVTLSDGNTLSRIRIDGGSVGLTSTVPINGLVADDVTVTNASGAGISLTGASGSVSFGGSTSITDSGGDGLAITNSPATISIGELFVSGSAGNGINLVGANGNVTIVNAVVDGSTNAGIRVSGATNDVTIFGTVGGTTVNGGAGILVENTVAGSTVAFGFMDVTASGGDAYTFANNAGDVLVSAGSVVTQTGTGDGVDISGGTGTVCFGSDIDHSGAGGAAVRISGTAGSVEICGDSITKTGGGVLVDIANASGGVDFGSIAFPLTLTASGSGGIRIENSSVSFQGPVSLTTGTADAVTLISNAGHTIDFLDGLVVDTTSGDGFTASGGGTIAVAARLGNRITTTTGQAIGLDGVTIGADGFTFDAVSADGAAIGIGLNNVGSAGGGIDLGTVTLSGITARGVDVSGTLGAGLDFASLAISLAGGTGTAFDLDGATLGATITAGDFDVINAGARGATIGVDLTGVAGNQIVRLGDTDPGGASSSIAGVETGVVISNGSAAQFTYGDGESSDRGSTIEATVDIAAPGTVASGASFNFQDLLLDGSPGSGFGIGRVFYVDSDGAATGGGDGTGRDSANMATLGYAEANAAVGDIIVLVNNGQAISAFATGADNTLLLLNNQQVLGFANGPVSIGFTAPTGIDFGSSVFSLSDPGSGAATLTSGTGDDVITLGASGNLIDGFILDGSPAGAARGIIGLGAVDLTISNMTIGNFTGPALQLPNLTGITTLTNVSVSSGAGGALLFQNAAGTVNAGNVDLSGASLLAVTGGDAVFTFDGLSSIANTGGVAVSLSGRTGGSFTYAGTVTSNGAGAGGILISNALATTTTFSNTVTLSTGALNAVELTNIGSTSFLGGLDITTTSGAGFTASGGATINVAAAGTRQISTATGQILSLNNVVIGAGGASFGNLTASGTVANTDAINLSNVSGASFLGGAVSIAGTSGVGSDGIEINNSSAIVNFGLSSVAINNTSGHGVNLVGANGTVTMFNTVVDGAAGAGVRISGTTGSVFMGGSIGGTTVNGGPGLLVENTVSGTVQTTGIDVRANGADAVQLANNAGAVIMDWPGTITQLGAGDGVDISGGTGSISIDSSIVHSGAAGAAVRIAGTSAVINFDGDDITKTVGGLTADISDATGTVQIGGVFGNAVTASGGAGGILINNSNVSFGTQVSLTTGAANGVTVANNSGRTVSFTRGLVIDTTSGTGFTANSGTINVAAAGTRQITTTSGQILGLNNVVIGAGGASFGDLSATSTVFATPIDLAGVSGGSVSAGTVSIAGTSGGILDGLAITNSSATFSFGAVTIDDTSKSGIALTGANGDVTFASIEIDGAGDDGVVIDGATNDVTINGGSIGATDPFGSVSVLIDNQAASSTIALSNLDITSDGFSGDLLSIRRSAGTITVTNGTFTQAGNDSDTVDIFDSSATITIGANLVHTGSGAFGSGAVEIDLTAGAIVFGGTITDSGGGRALDIGAAGAITGGSITFDGAITDTGSSGNRVQNLAVGAAVSVNAVLAVTGATADALSFTNNAGTLSFAGVTASTTGTGRGIAISDAAGSATYSFNGQVTLDQTGSTGNGVSITGAATHTVSFLGGLDITTTSGAGFTASGGATIDVAAAGNRQITTTTGQILSLNNVVLGAGGASFGNLTATGAVGADAISLVNVSGGSLAGGTVSIAATSAGSDGISITGSTANIGFGATTIGSTAGNGILLNGNGGTVSFGATSITNPADAGVDIGGSNGAISFADLKINLLKVGTLGLDLSGATVANSITAGDFDVDGGNLPATLGINLAGATGTGVIQLGDTVNSNPGGVTSTILNVARGVVLSSATNLANFIYGDGAKPAESAITTFGGGRVIDTIDTLPVSGSYNFLDAVLTGDTTNLESAITYYYVDADGSGTGTAADPGSIASALASSAQVIVLVDNTAGVVADTIDIASAAQGTGTTLSLDAGQALISFRDGPVDLAELGFTAGGAPASFLLTGVPAGGTVVSDPTGFGAPTLTTTSAVPTVTLAGSNGISGVVIENGGGAVGISGTNIAALILQDSTVRGGTAASGVALASSTVTQLALSNLTLRSGTGAPALSINGTGGTTSITRFEGLTVEGGAGTGSGIAVTDATFDSDTATAGFQSVAGGNTTIGTSGARVNGNGLAFTNVLGLLDYGAIAIANDGGTGLSVLNPKSNDFTLNNTGGAVDTTNGTAISLDPLTVDMTFASVNATGGLSGIIFDDVAGSFTVTGATTITGTTGYGINATPGNTGTFNFNTVTIDNTGSTGSGARIDSGTVAVAGTTSIQTNIGVGLAQTGGAIAMTGATTIQTASGIGVTQTGGTMNIAGVLSIATGTGQGIVTNGGTITATNPANTLSSTGAAAAALSNNTANLVFASTSSSASPLYNIGLQNVAGTLDFGTGTLAGAGNTGFRVLGGTATLSYAGSITSGTGQAVEITGRTVASGPITLAGTISHNVAGARGIYVHDNTGGTVTFSGTSQSITTGSANGVELSTNAGATVNFTGAGLTIGSATGTGFAATGGGTVGVAAGTIATTGTGTALNLDGVTVAGGGFNLSSVTANGAANGVLLANVASTGGGTVALGTVNLQNVTTRGVDISGTLGAATSFANLDISLGNSAAIAFDLNGATVGAAVTANDFDVTNNAAAGTSIGVDLRGALGGSVVRLGDAALAGDSSSIAGVNTGVFLNAATNLAFTYGDGESATDQSSTLSAVVGIDASAAPVAGTYNFRDILFPASPGLGFGVGQIYFVDSDGAGGGGSGSGIDGANPTTLAAAELASGAGDVIVLINNGSAITAAGTNADNTLSLSNGEQVRGFRNNNPINLALTVPSTIQLASNTISIAPIGSGAANLTTSAGADVITLGSQNNIIDGFILDGDPAGAARGINDNGGGATNTLVNNMTVRNFDTVGIEITPSTNTTITNTTFAGNVSDMLLNAAGTTITDVISFGATGTAFQLNNVTGTTTLTNVSITGAGGGGLAFTGTHAGTINATNVDVSAVNALNITGGAGTFTFDATSSITNASGAAVTIANRTGGAITFGGTVVANGATNGIVVSGATGANTVDFTGTVDLGVGSALTGTAVSLTNANTTTTFANIDIVTNNASGFVASGGGTVNVTTGTLSSTSAQAINLNGIAAGINFLSTTSSGGTNNATLAGVTGTVNLGSAGAFSAASGASFLASGGSANVTYGGTITKTSAGRLIDIQNRTAGTVTLSGNLSATGGATGIFANANTGGTVTFSGASKTLNTGANAAVNLTNNGGTTFNFTGGGLGITTTSATGFNATGGGAVTVQGTGNTITSGPGVALNVVNTNIGLANLTFQSISASGGANGILLNNTGTTAGVHGGLVVTGTGTADASGGVIQSISNRGISISSARAISLSNMVLNNANTVDGTSLDLDISAANAAIYLSGVTGVALSNVDISGTADNGITGLNVSNFTMDNSTITQAGNAANESGIEFSNLSGTSSISNTSITFSETNSLDIVNTDVNLNLTLDNVTFSDTQTVSSGGATNGLGEGGLQFRSFSSAGGAPVTDINILNSDFLRLRTQAIQVIGEDDSIVNVDITGSTIDSEADIGTGVDINGNDTSNVTFNVIGNTIQSRNGSAVNITSFLDANVMGRINNNVITVNTIGSGTRTVAQETSNMVVEIRNNDITMGPANSSSSIDAQARFDTARLDLTIGGNSINSDTTAVADINITSGSSTAGESNQVYVNIINNSVVAGGPNNVLRLRVSDVSNTNRLFLQGFVEAGAGLDDDAVATWNANGNTPTVTAANINVSLTGTAVAPLAGITLTPTNPLP
jgi:hypothetical protein